ncbi:hypothetical protein ES703_66849 [subsurface metagenome]
MWEKILVPLDGSDLAELALPYAQELAAAFNSEVVLLHVSEPAEKEHLHMHQLYMEKVAGQMTKHIEKVSPLVVSGKPAEEIVSYTKKNNIGLIIMASHGRSGIMPWATGGVSFFLWMVLKPARLSYPILRSSNPDWGRRLPCLRWCRRGGISAP